MNQTPQMKWKTNAGGKKIKQFAETSPDLGEIEMNRMAKICKSIVVIPFVLKMLKRFSGAICYIPLRFPVALWAK